jgi:ubiquinone/menaquinone biosynthesis C-methylase UbiE
MGWVLDAACGTGVMIEYLQEIGFEGNLLLVDASRKMVQKAKQRCMNGDIRYAVILADVNRLPIKPGSLGGIMCTFSLTTLREPKIALGELAKAMGPDRQLVILDSEQPSHPVVRILYPALVLISRTFCHTHIDRDVSGMLESNRDIEIDERSDFMGGMVAIYYCKKLRNKVLIE